MRVLIAAGLLALAGCSSTEAPGGRVAGGARPTPTQLVAQVRAAGVQDGSLEVQPLRDPYVEELMARAEAREAEGEHRAADAVLVQALALAPDDAWLLQHRAELALLRREWERAETLAYRAYEVGPRLGNVCRRNWTTIALAREARGVAAAEVASAREQVARCHIPPPARM